MNRSISVRSFGVAVVQSRGWCQYVVSLQDIGFFSYVIFLGTGGLWKIYFSYVVTMSTSVEEQSTTTELTVADVIALRP